MKYYIVLTSPTVERLNQEYSTLGEVPRSDLNLLSQNLNASFVKQESYPVKLIDNVVAKLSATSQNWAFARYLASKLSSDDVVFCPGVFLIYNLNG